MSARYGIGRLADSNEIPSMQRKLENLYNDYNYNSTTSNVIKCSEIIEQNANVQRKLYNSLSDITAEGPIYSTRRYPLSYYRDYYPYYYYPYYSYYPYATAASAIATADLAVQRTLSRKNAEIADLSYKYERDLDDLEAELSNTKLDNNDLKAELNETKEELISERHRSNSVSFAAKLDIAELKSKLASAEVKLASLEPKAELAYELEREILDLKSEIRRCRTTNAILQDHNELQAEIIRSRPASPVFVRSRPASPVFVRSRPVSPVIIRSRAVSPVCVRSRPTSPCARRSRPTTPIRLRATSPLSMNHCTQVIRQDALISRFNDLYTRDRLNALDILRNYTDDYENNQRIIFSTIQEAFSVAKRVFSDWKSRVRSTLSITHSGPDTLEEAVQNYINRNVDLYDMPYMSSEVVSSLNRNPKLKLPIAVSFTVISSFIRECCRVAWEMSTLAHPLDISFALDGDVFDDTKYRRTYDSEYSAPLVNHYVWPSLVQGGKVIEKGEAVTRRGAPVVVRSRNTSPLRSALRNRSPSPLRRSKSTFSEIRTYYY